MATDINANLSALSGLTDRQKSLMESANGQIDALHGAVAKTISLEDDKQNAIRSGNANLLKTTKDQIAIQEKVISSHSDLLDMVMDSTELRKEESNQIYALGKETTMFGKATRALDDKFNTLKDSSGLLGDFFANLSDESRKMALSFSASGGLLGGVAHKYASSLLEASTFLPEAIQGAGLIESSTYMGTMMVKTGLGLEDLTSQMKENRVAWSTNGEQIANFINDNEALRMKLGETREGFAGAAARASNFLLAGGTEQKNLSKETGKYLLNLNKLSIQSGRQASEIEDARRQAQSQAGSFLAELSGASRQSFQKMFSDLSDSAQKQNPIASMGSDIFAEGDEASRLAAIAEREAATRRIAMRAGVEKEEVDRLIRTQQLAAKGDAAAAASLSGLTESIGQQILAHTAAGGQLLQKGVGAIDEYEKQIAQNAINAEAIANESGATQKQLNKAAETAAKQLEDGVKTPMQDMLTTFSKWSNNFGVVGGDAIQTLAGLGALVPGLSALPGGIASMGGAMFSFAKGSGKFGIKSIGKMLTLGMGPIGLAITTLGIILPLVVTHWDDIVAAFSDIPGTFEKIKTMFTDMFPDASAFLKEWIITPVSNFLSGVFGGENAATGNFLHDWVVTPLTNYFKLMFGIWAGAGTFMADHVISPLTNWVTGLFGFETDYDVGAIFKEQIIDRISNFFGALGDFMAKVTSLSGLKSMLPASIAAFLPDDEPVATKTSKNAPTSTAQRKQNLAGMKAKRAELAARGVDTSGLDANIASATIEDPKINNNLASKTKNLENDIQTSNKREVELKEKASSDSATMVDKKELQDLKMDRTIQKAILEQLKAIASASKTSVVLQDSMNSKATAAAAR